MNEPEPAGSANRCVVITPARNEVSHLGYTIDAMRSQTVTPLAWYIVDDGSTDGTTAIIEAAEVAVPWIHLVRRPDRGRREAGGGVVEAVVAGIEAVTVDDWEVLVKLDADLTFEPDYFATCLAAFAADPQLGITGGTISNLVAGERISEPHPAFHVRGATKFYRRACWSSIGGLAPVPGWDTIDEVTAHMHGWTTRTLPVAIDQLRSTGEAAGQWSNWVKNGRAAYLSGYHPLFLMARAVRRMSRPPRVVAPVGLLWGYIRSAARREPRAVDGDVHSFVRSEQLRRLTGRTSMWR